MRQDEGNGPSLNLGAVRVHTHAAMDDLEGHESIDWLEETAHGRERTV